MSANDIPSNLPSVDRLVQRVVAAERSQQKEVRITIQEARELTTELSLLTTKLGKTVQEIHEMLSEIRNNTSVVDVKMDGGGF